MEKNKIQLWGVHFSCSLEVENFRGGAESSKGSQSTGPARAPLPATGQLTGPPACASPFSTACTALGQLRPNTATDHLALMPRHRSHLLQALHDPSGIPRKEPALIPHSSRAELLTEQTLVVTSHILPVLYSAQPRHFQQDALSCLLKERQSHPPTAACAVRGWREGEAMPKVAQALSG